MVASTIYSPFRFDEISREKSYHAYLSQDLKYDQVFVEYALHEIFKGIEIEPGCTIVLERDNCSLQYTSCQHLDSTRNISDKYNVSILRVFGNSEQSIIRQ